MANALSNGLSEWISVNSGGAEDQKTNRIKAIGCNDAANAYARKSILGSIVAGPCQLLGLQP